MDPAETMEVEGGDEMDGPKELTEEQLASLPPLVRAVVLRDRKRARAAEARVAESDQALAAERARADAAEARAAAQVPTVPPFPPPRSLMTPYDKPGRLPYIVTQAYKDAMALLLTIRTEYPSNEKAKFRHPVVIGPMGVGKTRLGKKVATELAALTSPPFPDGGVALYVDVNDLAREMKVWDVARTDDKSLLAAAIFHGVFPDAPVPLGLTLPMVKERVIKDWGKRLIVLHMDEFKAHAELTKRILKAANFTTQTDPAQDILVLPITTGVRPAYEWAAEEELKATDTDPKEIQLGRFPLPKETKEHPVGEPTDFERAFAAAIGIDWDTYVVKCKEVRYIFRDCGGHPRLTQDLADILNSDAWAPKRATMLADGGLNLTDAGSLFTELKGKAKDEYNKDRWHALVRAQVGRPGEHDSLEVSSKRVIRRVVLCAWVDRPVRPSDKVLKDVKPPPDARPGLELSEATYETCASSGLVDLKQRGPDVPTTPLTCPLIALMATNELCNVVPVQSRVAGNPFDLSPITHEELGMITLYLRLKAAQEFGDAQTSLASLRPGALSKGDVDNVFVAMPGAGLDMTTHDVFLSKLSAHPEWHIAVTAPNQEALDGLGVLRGGRVAPAAPGPAAAAATAAANSFLIVWASQMKKRLLRKQTSGDESETVLYELDVVSFIKEMRKEVKAVLAKLGATTARGGCTATKSVEAFVVYDVFTDRLPPKRNPLLHDVELQPNEALFVTTATEFPRVVGEAFSARQRMSALAKQP